MTGAPVLPEPHPGRALHRNARFAPPESCEIGHKQAHGLVIRPKRSEIRQSGRFTINQVFLIFTLIYILLPALMVVLSLLLKPRVNRIINIFVSVLFIITIIGSAIGETWVYYFLGSFIEVILLVAIARTAWKWPPPQIASSLP